MYSSPVGQYLSTEQATELDDTSLSSDPLNYFRSRIASLVAWDERYDVDSPAGGVVDDEVSGAVDISRRGIRLATVAEASGLTVEGATNVLSELIRTGMTSRDTYAAERRHDGFILALQGEVTKLQWILQNPGKKLQSSHRPKALKKPGAVIDPGYERTAFGDLCLQYLESMPSEDLVDVPQDEDPDDTIGSE